MILYNITNLRKIYDKRTVLDINKLTIEKGEVYTLTGPNGAGKTTFLKILALLDVPSHGEIEFMGKQISYTEKSLHQARQNVVLLDQNPIMFTGTVRENVGFGLRMRKKDKVQIEKRVVEMLDLVGMKKFIDHDANGLSGGETKRVALARALAIAPEVLICDEPSANVDNENQEMILDALGRANKIQGTSIVFSTHYLSQGSRLSDKVLLLQNGKLSDILNENIYRAQLVEKGDEYSTCQLSGQVVLNVKTDQLCSDAEFKVWLDPETISVSRAKSGEGKDVQATNSFTGQLLEVGLQKGMVKLCVDVGVRVIVHISYERYRKLGLLIGDKLTLNVDYSAIRCTQI